MSNTIPFPGRGHAAPARIGPRGLEAAFLDFIEGLGRRPQWREPHAEVIQARRCEPTRAELIAAAYLGAPVALSPLDTIGEEPRSGHAA